MASGVNMTMGGTVPRVPEDKEPGHGERKSVSAVNSVAAEAEVYSVAAPLSSRVCVSREATNSAAAVVAFQEVAVPNPFRLGTREVIAMFLVSLGN